MVSGVGRYDMPCEKLSPNGVFTVTGFGTVESCGQFAALDAYLPDHHVRHWTTHPAVLILTGTDDPRVDPANSRTMTAGRQAASVSDWPILPPTRANVGHGAGGPRSERKVPIAETDAYRFAHPGMSPRPAAAAAP